MSSLSVKTTTINRPVLFKYRSSKFFVFWTAAVGLFTSVKYT